MGYKKIDLTSKVFPHFKVIREFSAPYTGLEKNRATIIKLECLCNCGIIFFPYKTNVLGEKTTKCQACSGSRFTIGQKVGKFTIQSRDLKNPKYFLCLCECGNEELRLPSQLIRRKIPRCRNCIRCSKALSKVPLSMREAARERGEKNHKLSEDKKVGKKFLKLKVLKFSRFIKSDNEKRQRAFYICKCACGSTIEIRGDYLGVVKSCGCAHQDGSGAGEKNFKASLKNSEAKCIREMIASGIYTQREIAKIFNVQEWTINKINQRKSYIK